MKTLSEKAKSILKRIKSEKYSVKYDNFDIHAFKELLLKNPKIAATYMSGTDMYPQFEHLHQDVFDSLYKYSPEKFDDKDIAYEYSLNSQVMDAVMDSPQYKELRGMTRLDKLNAAVGTEVVGEQVKDLVKDLKDKFDEALKNLESAAENAADKEQAAGGDAEKENNGTGEGKSQEQISLEDAQKHLEDTLNTLNVVEKKEKRQINRMLDKAISKTQETSEMIANWGLEQDPNYQKSGYQEKLKLLETLNTSKKLKEIAALMGRYKSLALSTFKNKISKGVNSIYDIELGKDIGKLIPTEMSKLSHPLLKTSFKKNYVESNLLQYKYAGKEKKAKGPIVVCIDSSGSMHGEPEIWAKGVAMGLLEIARAENRSLHVIHFDASPKHMLHTNNFLKSDAYNVSEVLDMAEFFASGGTQFEPPLDLAKDTINDHKEFKKADIVFITDGNSAVRKSWLYDFISWKKQKNVIVHSVLVDVDYNTDCAINEFSDKISKLDDIRQSSADKVAEIIFSVV